MGINLENKGRTLALQIVLAQLVFTCALSLVGLMCYPMPGNAVAVAILSGGMICSLANLWLAIVAFRPLLGSPTGKMLAAFYVGEMGKFIITAALFLLAFKKISILKQPPYALLMLSTYVLVQAMFWMFPLVRNTVVARRGQD